MLMMIKATKELKLTIDLVEITKNVNNLKETKMGKKFKTKQVGRDAITGKFIPVKKAKKRRATAVVETMKIKTKKK